VKKSKKRRKIELKLKKQSQFIRIAYCVMRIAERKLKKQSQFAGFAQRSPRPFGLRNDIGLCSEIATALRASQ